MLADGPQTQADLARRLAVHRRTARRLLARLVDEGYAEATQRGRQVSYAATSRMAVLGRRVADGLDTVAIGQRRLATLDATRVGARFIGLLDGDSVRLAHVDDPRERTSADRLTRSGPLHATAVGKVFLSADNALLDDVLNQELLAFTADTLVTRADLLLELAKVRAQGYAVEAGEHRVGAQAAACGVTNHVGRVVLALGAVPAPEGTLDDLGRLLRETALAVSRESGGAPSAP